MKRLPSSPVKIFIVYAREDTAYKDGLIKALSPLKNQGWVESWHDGNIEPGAVWSEQIRQSLNAADVVLPLVSSDFFASEYIQQVEIRHAFERYQEGKCTVIPVIVRACAWETDERLARLQVLPAEGKPIGSWANRDEAYQSVVDGIRRIVRPDSSLLPTALPSQIEKNVKFKLISLAFVVVVACLLAYFGCPRQPSPDALEQQAFQAAIAAGNIPALVAFQREHPEGFRAVAAQQREQRLRLRFDSCVASARALLQGGEKDAAREAARSAFGLNPKDTQLNLLIQQLDK